MDELTQAGSAPDAEKPSGSATVRGRSADSPVQRRRSYGRGARRTCQLKTVDLLPVRWWALTIVLVGLAAVITGLNWLAAHRAAWSQVIDTDALSLLDLTAAGGLTSWFAAAMWLGAAGVSLQLLQLRQHRWDDYRGSYRLWLWIAVLCVLASIDAVSHVRGTAHELAARFGPELVAAHLPWLWPVAGIVIVVALAMRLTFELRRSRTSLVFIVFSATAAVVAIGLSWRPELWALTGADLPLELAVINLLLAGQWACVAGSLVYARHVYLEAHGLLRKPEAVEGAAEKPAKVRRRGLLRRAVVNGETAATNDKAAEPEDQQFGRAAAAVNAPNRSSKIATPARIDRDTGDNVDETEESSGPAGPQRGLSKAEKRRLRKEARQARRAA